MDHQSSRRRSNNGGRERSRSRSISRGDNPERSRSIDKGDRYRSRRHHSRNHSSKKQKKDNRHRRHHEDDSSGDESSSLSSSSSTSSRSARRKHAKKRHRKDKKKKHKKKKDKKKHKSKKKSQRRSRSRDRSPSKSPQAPVLMAPPGAHELASALTQLFHAYPAMSSLDEGGVPLLFIQLSRGTEYNLSQMPDRNLARLLEVVFQAMSIHGMELGGNGAWRWSNAAPSGGKQSGNDLALLRLTRALLNGVGFSMDKVEMYEQELMQKPKQLAQQEGKMETHQMSHKESTNSIGNAEQTKENEKDTMHKKRVERMASQMLDRFDQKNTSSSESSLANELQGICDVLLEGEIIQLDGIENAKLKATLAQLFQLTGLELVEMENDEKGDIGDGSNEEKAMGYALPDMSGIRDTATSYLSEVLRVCRFRSSGGSENAPKSWAANPANNREKAPIPESSSDDDDDGPAPLGTVAAVKASKRKRPPQMQNKATAGGIEEGGREEWMMVPGEHDFLKGIQAGGEKATRSRTFKNEKNRGQSIAGHGNSAEPINPKILEEVDAIQQAYQQSRGPSLFDAHRQTQQERKQQQQGKKEEFKWSRDKNLDDGRRVDKNALHLVLGGASTELKSKFQGSLGR